MSFKSKYFYNDIFQETTVLVEKCKQNSYAFRHASYLIGVNFFEGLGGLLKAVCKIHAHFKTEKRLLIEYYEEIDPKIVAHTILRQMIHFFYVFRYLYELQCDRY